MSAQEIIDIFYSNFNAAIDYSSIYEIFDLIEKDFIIHNKITICKKENYDLIIEKVSAGAINTFDFDGGQIGHLALKYLAKELLETKGHRRILFEYWFQGRKPDVMTSDKTIIIECGDTDPNKIIEYFENPKLKKVFVIPYPREGEKEIIGYVFSKTDGLRSYLNDKINQRYNNIRKIIQRR